MQPFVLREAVNIKQMLRGTASEVLQKTADETVIVCNSGMLGKQSGFWKKPFMSAGSQLRKRHISEQTYPLRYFERFACQCRCFLTPAL